jgi:hypothetical protein
MSPEEAGVTSARRRDANRRNARSSTGPRTAAGKARAAQNARRHGLSLPARYDPSRFDEIDALARAIAGVDTDAERLELARRVAEAQIDIIRARAARRDLFPASPAALLEPGAIARLAATDRYERRAWSRRKRAIRALDDARAVERAGDFAGDLAERSQLRKAMQPASVAPTPQAAGSSEAERRASSDAPSANLTEQRELAERSQREAFRLETTGHSGRTNPMATGSPLPLGGGAGGVGHQIAHCRGGSRTPLPTPPPQDVMSTRMTPSSLRPRPLTPPCLLFLILKLRFSM